MVKKGIYVMLICLFIFPIQSAFSGTVVNFAGGGPLENAVYAFQFEVRPNSGWTFTPGDAVPSSWTSSGSTSGSPIFFVDSIPRENPLISGKQLGNFGTSNVSLSNFTLTTLIEEDLFTIPDSSYNVDFNESLDTYTIIGVPVITCDGDFDKDGDVDGKDAADQAAGGTGVSLKDFASNFGKPECSQTT